MKTSPPRLWVVLTWLSTLTLAAGILSTRLNFSYDLALFLPQASNPEQQVLLERLGDGPGSRFILIAIPRSAQQRQDVVGELAAALTQSPAFSRVLTESSLDEMDSVPEPVWTYRYLLADVALDAASLQTALSQRRAELTLMAGGPLTRLIQSDPQLTSIELLESFSGAAQASWRGLDGSHLLIAETAGAAFDLGQQQVALKVITDTLTQLAVPDALLSGIGVFGVGLQDTISREATVRSIAASIALALVLVVTYRKLAPLWLAALPLVTGMLLGLTAVAVGFGQIHGITLAFGFTLLGIALDYPLHLISASRRQPPEQAAKSIWPTLRLGAASTALAYLAIALGGSEGLAQLGVFSLVGVVTAALTTRWLLPALMAKPDTEGSPPWPMDPLNEQLPRQSWLAVPTLALLGLAALGGGWQGQLWDNNLSAMSPVPTALIKRDTELRGALGTPDLSRQIMLRDSNLEQLLERSSALHLALGDAVDQGLIGQYQSVASLLPSARRQRQRQLDLPEPSELKHNLADASAGLPFRMEAFAPFLKAVQNSRELPLLTPRGFDETPLKSVLDQFLYRAQDQWVSLVALYPPIDSEALAAWLGSVDQEAAVIDLKRASEQLVADYRIRTFGVLGLALVVIGLLLLWRLPVGRAGWCVATVLSVLVACAGTVYLFSGPLNLYHMMALLLVAGLGLDYALFLSRPGPAAEARLARHAVTACAASTALTFAVLALSEIPALAAMGSTVAVGTSLAFIATRLTSGPKRRSG